MAPSPRKRAPPAEQFVVTRASTENGWAQTRVNGAGSPQLRQTSPFVGNSRMSRTPLGRSPRASYPCVLWECWMLHDTCNTGAPRNDRNP